MTKRSGGGSMVGASSLLVIFAVLCLVIFALLSLSTAKAGERLSLQSTQSVSAYYQADCAAEEILARLRAGEVPDCVSLKNGVYSYTCPISQTQELLVEVRLEGEDYTILRWQSVSAANWERDDTLVLWDGETI